MTVPVAPGAPADTAPATPPPPVAVPPAQPTPAAVPVPPAATPATSTAIDPAEFAKVKADAERLQAEARKHEGRWKERDERAAQTDALLKTLAEKAGIEFEGKPDPEKLVAQLTSAQQAAADRSRELAIFRAAAGAGANADSLLDSRQFMARTADLDPASADFSDRVKALVAETVTANPTLIVTPATAAAAVVQPPAAQLPASSGGDFSGAPATAGQWTLEMVDAASAEQVAVAIDKGLLKDLGHGARRHGRNR